MRAIIVLLVLAMAVPCLGADTYTVVEGSYATKDEVVVQRTQDVQDIYNWTIDKIDAQIADNNGVIARRQADNARLQAIRAKVDSEAGKAQFEAK